MSKPKVVILGAGYGGLVTAIRLQKQMKASEMDVTLVNKHDYHYITTHLHMPAAGTDHHENARVAIADLIDERKIHFVKSTVSQILPEEKKVVLGDRDLSYDYLVIGLGSETETFGIPGMTEYAMSIKSINSVRFIRQHIEYMFAKSKMEPKRKEYLTFVVGGAGFTGTEFVGELADRIPVLSRTYDVDPSTVQIINIEASPSALPPGLPEDLVEYGMEVMRRKGVQYKLSTPIKECTPDGVILGNGEFIRAGTVVWSGGIRGNSLLQQAGFDVQRGRVKVDECLRSYQYPDVFITGDCSIVMSPEGTPYPANAQIAVQQGYNVARNLLCAVRGRDLKPFAYDFKGTVASLGKGEAVGLLKVKKVKGKFAALLKKVIDARYLYLIGGIPLIWKKMIFKQKTTARNYHVPN
ncbi:NAD(P)/FAD-dependent oxidoreductase [Paenibacillus alginolyticus]|uniref:NAD(P)/FAD-dependent oxidoreductase n=1 Tax=Paenibacillus alginolyticus TaxID=59839 RepID=A0ABT4G9N2_9BACL|nr:NAD(P)/FAD-dependent oxidoreductase [Paenibacillus alginolyticus]MCY9692873.1 NAD(P)/FAD-dependent oxidoreductase [Paenibacillus alginolyticus]MEC0142931.1 NAD(P)/FAD-dependent oxidoreductase [Paenibacillus alginolyticus]